MFRRKIKRIYFNAIAMDHRAQKTGLGIILEFKRAKSKSSMDALLEAGLTQIDAKAYDVNLSDFRYITEILKISLVFYGKQVKSQSHKIRTVKHLE